MFSAFIYLVVRYLIRYRINIVRKNREHTGLMFDINDYYRQFAKTFVNIIKSFIYKPELIKAKVKYENLEDIKASMNGGKKVMILASHYSNWEWVGVNLPSVLNGDCIAVYKPLSVSFLDKIIRKRRNRTGMKLAAMSEVVKYIHQYPSGSCFLFIADQSPAYHQKDVTVPFLGVSTSFFEGPSKLANRFNFEVFYQSVHEKGDTYTVKFHKISDTNNIIQEYALLLEKDVKENPYLWLWTHKRWKKNSVSYQ